MPSRSIPYPAQPIIATRANQRALPVKTHGGDGIRVRGEHLEALPGLDVPDPNRLVEGSRHDHVGLWVVGDAEDVVGVAG